MTDANRTLGFEHVCKVRGIHDLGVGTKEDGGCRHNHRRRIDKCQGKLPDIRMGQVERFDSNPAADQCTGEVLHHLLGAPMHRDIGDHDLVFHGVRYPVGIGIENERGMAVDGPVARCNHLEGESFYHLHIPFDAVPERHHDLGIIPLCRAIDLRLVSHVEIACPGMRPEEIAGKEDLVLAQVGDLGFRPVCPGSEEKFKRAVAEREGLFILDDPEPVFRQMEMGRREDLYTSHSSPRVHPGRTPGSSGGTRNGPVRRD